MMKRTIFLAMLASTFLFCGNAGSSQVQPTAAIAYIRNGSEIRLIDPDGKNDRRIWTHPDAKEPLGLFDVAWRPDGKELAFSSAHGALYSLYHADLYAIRPDGFGFRKLTNAPDRSEFGKYKKGSVTVTVRNNQYSFRQAQSSSGIFIVNVIGSEEPQQITLPPGSSKTLVFRSVADFGDHAQALVAMNGPIRWFMPGTDVKAGTNVKAPDLLISGDGIELYGAFRPVWRNDGSEISFRNGLCLVSSVPANPTVGELASNPFFSGKHPAGACVWDWGPTPALKDQVIYSQNDSPEGSGFYLMKEKGEHPGQKLIMFTDLQYQIAADMHWLPDGSGILYSTVNLYRDRSNIFRYDFKSKRTTQVTKFENEFVRRFCVSPDGKWIVFERTAKSMDDYENVDLWMIRPEGTEMHLLVKNGLCPGWSR